MPSPAHNNAPRRHDLDEQLWPVNIALVLLCGFIGGLIAAHSEFDFERVPWYENGWTRLATLFVSVGAFIALSVGLGGHRGRRFQFAALISLLLHSVLGWRMYTAEFLADGRGRDAIVVDPQPFNYDFSPEIFAPEIVPQQDFERPVESKIETARTGTAQIERIERTAAPPKPTTVDAPSSPVDRTQPKPLETAPRAIAPKVEQAAPRRDELASKLARVDKPDPRPVVEAQTPVQQTPRATAPREQMLAQADTRARGEDRPRVDTPTPAAPTRTETMTELASAAPAPRRRKPRRPPRRPRPWPARLPEKLSRRRARGRSDPDGRQRERETRSPDRRPRRSGQIDRRAEYRARSDAVE
ncbi:MAG: hypothetical protein QM811_27920 [Pirellulales bacterium]